MTTPLSAREILGGKFLGGLRRQWFAPVWMAAHFTLSVAAGVLHPAAPLQVAAACISASIFLTGTGLLLSVLFRRSTTAAVANIALALALWAALPIGIIFMSEIFDVFEESWPKRILTGALAINPLAMSVLALDPATDVGARAPFANLDYDLPIGDTLAWKFTGILGAACGAAIFAGLASLLIAIRLFPRISGRSS